MNHELKKQLCRTIAAVFAWGLFAHGYCFFNLLYSHDSMLVYQNDVEAQFGLGRFLHPVYFKFRGHFYAPTLVGVLSLLFLALAIWLIFRLFDIDGIGEICVLTGILVTNVTITLINATYIHDIDIYACSLLLAVAAVWLCRKYRFGILPGIVLLCCSLALYQSFFQVALFLFMMLAVMDILRRKSFAETMKNGIRALVMLFAGLVVYYITLKIVLRVSGFELSTAYNGISQVGQYSGVGQLVTLFRDTCLFTRDRFLMPRIQHSGAIGLLNVLLLLMTVIGMVCTAVSRHVRALNAALLAVLVLLMPFGINVIYFISMGMEHDLMYYSFFLVYVLAYVVLRETMQLPRVQSLLTKHGTVERCVRLFVPAVIVVISFNSVIYANQVYLKKDLEYRNTQATMNRIVDRMEQTDGYVLGETPVAFVGLLCDSELAAERPGFDTGGVGLERSFAVSFRPTYPLYFEYILGYPIEIVNKRDTEKLSQTEDVQNMSPFPAKNSCRMVDGVLVVKLSD